MRVFVYPRGGFEGVIRPRYSTTQARPEAQGSAPSETDPETVGDREAESSAPRRAKTAIRRHILGTGCDRMLTLTYRENWDDLRASDVHVTKLLRTLKRWHPTLNYLAVHEYQKRGAIHWHIALDQRVDIVAVRSLWHKIVGALGGSVNIRYFPNPARQAAYLAKYIGKDLDEEKRGTKKRYKKNRGFQFSELYFRAYEVDRLFAKFKELAGGQWDGSLYEHEGTIWLRAY